MSIPIITVSNQPERAQPLIDSAHRNGWETHLIRTEWKGFGTKLLATYNFLKEHPEVESFVFADAHDVIVLGTPEEFESKLPSQNVLLSAEKGLWPPSLIPFRKMYFQHEHGFNYINSGLYYSPSQTFIELIEGFPPFYEIDDQMWLNLVWLLNDWVLMELDTRQNIFNSHSFIAEGEYTYDHNTKRIEIMGNKPIFVHFNGSTKDEKFNQMLAI